MNDLDTLSLYFATRIEAPSYFELTQRFQKISVVTESLEDILDPLGNLIAQSPDLHTLDLRVWERGPLDLDKLLSGFPSMYYIANLRLHVWTWSFASNVTPLKGLTSLHILNTRWEHDDAHETRLWTALKHHRILLRELAANVTFAVLEYIASYSGLRRLKLCLHDRSANSLASRFFECALLMHSESLEELTVKVRAYSAADRWYFGKSIAPHIARCQNLRSLSVSIYIGRTLGERTVSNPMYD